MEQQEAQDGPAQLRFSDAPHVSWICRQPLSGSSVHSGKERGTAGAGWRWGPALQELPSSSLSLSCWQSVSWWRSTLGQGYTKAMPLLPQSHHPQSQRVASTSSAGACWAIRTVTQMPSRNLRALTPALCQMGPGSASMKSRFCRRETLESWPQLCQNKKLDRVVHAKLLQLCRLFATLWTITH